MDFPQGHDAVTRCGIWPVPCETIAWLRASSRDAPRALRRSSPTGLDVAGDGGEGQRVPCPVIACARGFRQDACMDMRDGGLLRWQWSLYAAGHHDRRNLLVHAATNPLFL